jgi:glycosyltransferase involved in cell wall biosynthesis
MNVATFASAFYPHLGGVEELVRQLAHAYRDAGVSNVIITNRWPRSLPAYEEYEGIPVYRLALRVPDGAMKAHVNYYLTHPLIRRQVFSILKKHEIDLVHVQCISANGYYALEAHKVLGLPLVISTHGERTIDASSLYQRSPFMNKVLRRLLAEADFITACSQHTLDDLERYWGTPFGERAGINYNGVEPADFTGPEGPYEHPRPYILGIGRLVSQKAFDVLLKAYAQSEVTTHDLLIAGEGSERPALEQLTARLGLQDRVFFTGRADRPMAVSLFKGASFVTMPSRAEPQGIVVLEAMAAGKALAASRVGGIPEMVEDGESGLLVPPEDAGALAAAIRRLAADPDLRRHLEAGAERRAQDFTWRAIAARYIEIYESLVKTVGTYV